MNHCNECRSLKGQIAMLNKEIEILREKLPELKVKRHPQNKTVSIPEWAKGRGAISYRT